MPTITITLSVSDLLMLPGDAITRILDKAQPPAAFLEECRAWETRPDHGKGRWPVLNHIRRMQARF
jgi:hypothetical protein